MIKVDDYQDIRNLARQGLSKREIARQTGHSRNTVKKILENPEQPKYNLQKPKPLPVIGDYKPVIDHLIEADEKRLYRKQRLTTRRLYEILTTPPYSYQGAESTLRHYVGQVRKRFKPVSVPLTFAFGESAQCDWGEARVIMDGTPRVVEFFAFRLSASRMPFVMAMPCQRQECFLLGHVQAFQFLGGVPLTVMYDNLKTAVKRVLHGTDRIEQEGFTRFCGYHPFRAMFCNVARGNEKGRIESLVGFSQRQMFTPILEVADYDALNEYLLSRCHHYAETTHVPYESTLVKAAWEEEQRHLLPVQQPPYDCCRVKFTRANGYSQVRLENNFYSVPVAHAHDSLVLKVYPWHIEVYAHNELIAGHNRLWGQGQEQFELDHYLDLLEMKARAVPYARPMRTHAFPSHYVEYFKGLQRLHPEANREFVRILKLHRLCPVGLVSTAITEALDKGQFSFDAITSRLPIDTMDTGKASSIPHGQSYVDPISTSHFDRLTRASEGVVH